MPKKNTKKAASKKAPESNKKDKDDGDRRINSSSNRDSEMMAKTARLQEQETEEKRKYKSRNIESNWDKYEEEELVERGLIPETQFRNTGASFTDLITQSGTDTSAFMFKDESEWDLHTVKENTATPDANSLLSLDLQKISKSLDRINLYKKLGLSSTLDSISEPGFQWLGNNLENLKKEQLEDVGCSTVVRTNNGSDSGALKWSFGGAEAFEKPVKDCLEKIKKDSTEQNDVQGTGTNGDKRRDCNEKPGDLISSETQEKSKTVEEQIKSPKKSMLESAGSIADVMDNVSADSDDDELDFLLSMSMPQKETKIQHSATSSDTVSKAKREEDKTEESNVVKNDKTEDQQVLANNDKIKIHTTPDDLEDWLDTILE